MSTATRQNLPQVADKFLEAAMESCPKCKGEMERGEMHGMVKWASVPADASFLRRLWRGLMLIRVDGMRCKQCGFLELYARER